MKLATISVTYDRKLNLGDYNSAHIAMTLWAQLEDGDDPAPAAEALRQMARHQVMAELARLQPSLKAKVEDIFMGLPLAVRERMYEDPSTLDNYDNGGDPANFGDR